MSRLRADLCLLLTAFLWGMAFIAQKTGLDGLGAFGFTGVRFALSILVVLPFALRERRNARQKALPPRQLWLAILLGVIFFLGVITQQAGIMGTTITNAGFLTGLYVIFVPLVAWFLFHRPPPLIVLPACLIALAGVWLLSGASLQAFTRGDWLVLSSALLYGIQIPLLGLLVQKTGRPLALVLIQYVACTICGLTGGLLFEEFSVAALQENMIAIAYAGLISGGIAYTLQAIAQQYTPPSHAAIIMLLEAPFAALGGVIALGERLDMLAGIGCALIFVAALVAESGAFLRRKVKTP